MKGPEDRAERERCQGLAVGAMLAALGCAFMPLAVGDEGLPLSAGYLIASGGTLYRDLWAIYLPGQYALMGLVFRLFGPSLAVSRSVDWVVKVALLVALVGIMRRLSMRGRGLLVLAGASLALVQSSYAMVTAMMGCLWLALAWDRALEKRSATWAACAGALVGMVFAVRWDFGVYGVLAIMLAWAWEGLKFRAWWTGAATAMVAAIFVAVALLAPLTAGARAECWQDTVSFIFDGRFAAAYHVPMPGWAQMANIAHLMAAGHWPQAFQAWSVIVPYYFPWLVVVLLGWSWRRALAAARERSLWLVVAALGALFWAQAYSRNGFEHAFPACAMALILLGHALQNGLIRAGWKSRWALAIVVVLAFFVFPLKMVCGIVIKNYRQEHWPAALWAADQEQAVARIRQVTASSDKVIVVGGLEQSDASFYFMAQRPPAYPFAEYFSGVNDSARAKEALRRALEPRRYWVVYFKSGPPNDIPSTRDLALRGYRLDGEWGNYSVWRP